ncbi:MAG: hypothetical protein WBE72_20365 [Terracidiphilus sp.]
MRNSRGGIRALWRILPLLLVAPGFQAHLLKAQSGSQNIVSEQIQKLTDAIARTQAQLDESQRQLDEMRRELAEMQIQMARSGANAAAAAPPVPAPASSSSASSPAPESATAAIDDIRERQAFEESQIATHEQEKVESESKYPVKITGLLLLNGFVNTSAVDLASTPTVAIPGSGSTGASVRQTVLGIDARGPHLFGARSWADLRVDFDGNPQSGSSVSGYYGANATLLRLRTAHAALQWNRTEAFFALDRPLISPNIPTSLTAVAEPALAWSGNLWNWNPQAGLRQDLGFAGSRDVRLEAALTDVADAPLTPLANVTAGVTPALANGNEESRWPGVEARVSLLGAGSNDDRNGIGFGGYFAPHRSSLGYNFDSWAGTLDARLLLPAHLQLTGSFYRGLALGGLGGGAYKDFAYQEVPATGKYYFKSLDDVGGWAQLKEKFSERLELNAAFGMDNVFAGELQRYAFPGGNFYQNLARNRTFTGNAIFSPSAYLLFSLEYRHLESSPVAGVPAGSNIIGVGAGYKF